MKFHFSRHNLKGRQKTLERFFEIIPAAASWTVLAGMAAFSFYKPLIAAVIIIAFDIYWLLRLFYMNIFLVLSYGRLSLEKRRDWMAEAAKAARKLVESGRNLLRLEDIYHLVIVPVARETAEIVEPGIKSIAGSRFPAKRILVVLAVEERAPEDVKRDAVQVQQKYRKDFFDLLVTLHPSGIRGEAKVKGANATWAAKKAAEYLAAKKIPFENVVASCFDADTVVSENYFSCLAYHYLICPQRTRASFQPIPVYHNNIWQAPGFARVLDIGSSFFQLIEATNPEKLVTFSSHSMSFKALVDIGYWPVDMISDDSAVFWKAFIHFNADYKVVPMYVTLSMDVTEAENWWRTIVNVYRQKRRWAWGVENFPIVMRAFLQAKEIPWTLKIKHGFKLFEAHLSWTTWPFLLSVIGWLPAVFAGREFSHSIFYYSAPRITGIIFSLASLGLVVCILLSLLLLPRRKIKHSLWKKTIHALEWLLVPPISVFLSAIPALDAQTRLALGKYMEFWVTVKKRK